MRKNLTRAELNKERRIAKVATWIFFGTMLLLSILCWTNKEEGGLCATINWITTLMLFVALHYLLLVGYGINMWKKFIEFIKAWKDR